MQLIHVQRTAKTPSSLSGPIMKLANKSRLMGFTPALTGQKP